MQNQNKGIGKRKRFFWSALVLLLLGLGAGPFLSRAHASGALEQITIATVPSLESSLLYIALGKGYFKKEGVDAVFKEFQAGKVAMDALFGGGADFATVSENPLMIEAFGGSPFFIIATISETPNANAVIARKDRGISAPAHLEGKKIGIMKGTGAEWFLDLFLTFSKIRRTDVTLINVPVDQGCERLMKGEVDAVVTFGPSMQRLLKEGRPNLFIDYGQGLYRLTYNLISMQDYVKKNPEAVRKILRALVRASAFLKDAPVESQKPIATYMKMDEASFKEAWHQMNLTPRVTLSPNLLLNMEDQARWAIRNKLTDKRTVPNYLNYIYFQGLEAVKPDAVTIVH